MFFQHFMNKLFRTIVILAVLLLPAALLAGGSANGKVHTVILDPGHGGRDYGAVGAITNEKTINLNVGLEVRKLLQDNKALKMVMTRSDDRFIELQERANIANRNHGDLFVSIHVNSVAKSNKNRRNIAGASVYTLGLHRTASNLEVAKRENAVMELESDYSTKYQGFDPNSTESYIMFELSQNKHLDKSIHFADLAVQQLCGGAGRRNRGVLQAGFWVLHASAMPSVLIELDFICNPDSEKFMHSKAGVKKMARAIASAIVNYFGIVDNVSGAESERKTSPELHPDPCPEPVDTPSVAPVQTVTVAADSTDAVTYRVQFMAANRSLNPGSQEFKGLDKVEEYVQGGYHKFTAGGDFATESAAEEYAVRVVRKKFPSAFVIKWKNGQRLN